MKRPILILFVLFSLFSATAQRHYYVGVPFHVGYLEDSTRFVIDCLPWHPNGRLDQKYMPHWSPALKNGRPVRSRYQMPMHYFLGN